MFPLTTSLELKHDRTGDVYGYAVPEEGGGWRFYPRVPGRKPGNKRRPTADACLPPWARKLLGCCSFLPKSEAA